MKQIYYKYTEWEDFKNGMFSNNFKNDKILISKAMSLLSNEVDFYNTSLMVLNNWVKSSKVNLSNINSNRRAWVGQAACSYKYKVPEIITRRAWVKLSESNKIKANLVADKIIKIYEAENKRIYKDLGIQMLFKWDS